MGIIYKHFNIGDCHFGSLFAILCSRSYNKIVNIKMSKGLYENIKLYELLEEVNE